MCACFSRPFPRCLSVAAAPASVPRPRMIRHPLRLVHNNRRQTAASMAVAAAGGGNGRQPFAGRGSAELAAWLGTGGIPVADYGQGAAKSVDQLWEEVEAGETQLFMGEDGRPQREVSVLNVLLQNSQGQILYEDEQVLPNGARRARGLPLSEKLLPGERWQDAVVRGVIEELGPVLPADPKVEVDEGSMRETVETKESKSYPGLLSRYVCKRVSASVVSGLPEGAFATDEERSDGLLRHLWVWR